MRFLRVLLLIVVLLAVLAGLGVLGVWYATDQALAKRITVSTTFNAAGGNVAHGEHLVRVVASCVNCHGADLGGKPLIDDPNTIGVLWAPNITTGPWGVGQRFSDTDFEHAIRHGINQDGTRLLFMPSAAFSVMSDQDLRDVIAFLRDVTQVQRKPEDRELGPLGRFLLATGQFKFPADEIAPNLTPPARVPATADATYGKYLAHIALCFECHGADLAGGHYAGSPSDPPARNITPAAIGSLSLRQFEQTIKTGVDPSGRHLNTFMPWPSLSGMNDQEFAALYAFLRSVPPVNKSP